MGLNSTRVRNPAAVAAVVSHTRGTTMGAAFIRLVIAVLVLGSSSLASAQTADEVIEKHLAAIGGRAALAKLESRLMIGTITLSTLGGDVTEPAKR